MAGLIDWRPTTIGVLVVSCFGGLTGALIKTPSTRVRTVRVTTSPSKSTNASPRHRAPAKAATHAALHPAPISPSTLPFAADCSVMGLSDTSVTVGRGQVVTGCGQHVGLNGTLYLKRGWAQLHVLIAEDRADASLGSNTCTFTPDIGDPTNVDISPGQVVHATIAISSARSSVDMECGSGTQSYVLAGRIIVRH